MREYKDIDLSNVDNSEFQNVDNSIFHRRLHLIPFRNPSLWFHPKIRKKEPFWWFMALKSLYSVISFKFFLFFCLFDGKSPKMAKNKGFLFSQHPTGDYPLGELSDSQSPKLPPTRIRGVIVCSGGKSSRILKKGVYIYYITNSFFIILWWLLYILIIFYYLFIIIFILIIYI